MHWKKNTPYGVINITMDLLKKKVKSYKVGSNCGPKFKFSLKYLNVSLVFSCDRTTLSLGKCQQVRFCVPAFALPKQAAGS